MTEIVYFKQLDLSGIESELIENLKEIGDDWGETVLPITQELLNQFNHRQIFPQNINDILSLCDYLLIKDTMQFIFKFVKIGFTYELSERHKTNYELPKCMMGEGEDLEDKIRSSIDFEFIRYIDYYKRLGRISNFHISYAIIYGKLNSIKHLYELGYRWNTSDVSTCARFGHLNCLKYIYEKDPSFFMDSIICVNAVEGGIECLKFVREIARCSWTSYSCKIAAKNGNLDCLKYLIQNGCPYNDLSICSSASFNGHLDCLKFAHESECPWDHTTCESAVRSGNFHCLKYAIENGCDVLFGRLCELAAERGDLSCLKYVVENGSPWNPYVSNSAAFYGHIDCLKYAHEHGCPLSDKTPFYAIIGGNPECLRYAVENGCKFDIDDKLLHKYIQKIRGFASEDQLYLLNKEQQKTHKI
tara:strand:- start:353 stop:1600 length:1248 start_codon:yes stop_codon:yes gene_type:complete